MNIIRRDLKLIRYCRKSGKLRRPIYTSGRKALFNQYACMDIVLSKVAYTVDILTESNNSICDYLHHKEEK